MKIDTSNGRTWLRPSGELDLSTVEDLESRLREIEETDVAVIVLDLSQISFMDSTGLRLVITADDRARKEGRRFLLVKGPENVHRVFRIALLDRRLEFIDDEQVPT